LAGAHYREVTPADRDEAAILKRGRVDDAGAGRSGDTTQYSTTLASVRQSIALSERERAYKLLLILRTRTTLWYFGYYYFAVSISA